MKKYILFMVLFIFSFLLMGQKPDVSTPEKTMQLYYEALNDLDRNKLALAYYSDTANYYFRRADVTCIYKYKILSQTAYNKKRMKKEGKRKWRKLRAKVNDVRIITSTEIKCSNDYQSTGKFVYWLRKIAGVWKIYRVKAQSGI